MYRYKNATGAGGGLAADPALTGGWGLLPRFVRSLLPSTLRYTAPAIELEMKVHTKVRNLGASPGSKRLLALSH